MKNTLENPYVSTYGTFAKAIIDVTFKYPNESEKTLTKYSGKDAKELVKLVKDYGGVVINVTSYRDGEAKDVTARYIK